MANHHFNSIVEASHRGASIGCGRAAFRFGASAAALVVASAFVAQPAAAQAAPPPNLVSVCSGVSLPRSAITDTVAPVIDGIVGPLEGAVNPLLGAVGLDIDTTTLLQQAAAGDPITLQVLNINGNVVGPDDRCDATADSISLDNPQGISIGGNRITGLGSVGEEAVAGEEDSIAFGNNAATDASSVGAIAIGTGAGVGAGSTGSIAFGAGSNATVANSIALGAGSVADRGALTGYQAPGLTAAQNSVGELSIGADGAERQITHVAAGTAPTDAVNMAQFEGVANSLDALSGLAVLYDGADHSTITLGGPAGTTITNLAPGNLSDTSTDAVNGSQLYATNQNVAANRADIDQNTTDIATNRTDIDQNTTDIANNRTDIDRNTTDIANNRADIDQNTTDIANNRTDIDQNTTDIANNRTDIDQNTTDITNNRTDIDRNTTNIATNTNDITTINQRINNINNGAFGTVQYSNPDAPATPNDGTPTNDVTLVGAEAAPVGLHNVADGTVADGSTDAVNGGQLYQTNQAVSTAQDTADSALALGQNSVQYDDDTHTSVTLGDSGSATPVGLHNVAAGVANTDAVNVGQFHDGLRNAVTEANAYSDMRFASLDYDIGQLRDDAQAGTATALATAGLPQAFEAGKGMIALGAGTYRGESALALGLSKAMLDDHTVVKAAASFDTRGYVAASGGVGYQF